MYKDDNLNCLNLYLYGVILKLRNKEEKAKEVLIRAINKFPLLWSAWLELNMMLKKGDQAVFKKLPNHWIK